MSALGGSEQPAAQAPQVVADSEVEESEQPARKVRYVPYNGLSQEQSDDSEEAAPAATPTTVRVVTTRPSLSLSEVLGTSVDESTLIYGSDGSEGGILPIDNGVVASSGPALLDRLGADFALGRDSRVSGAGGTDTRRGDGLA